jgi:hypothetical protein
LILDIADFFQTGEKMVEIGEVKFSVYYLGASKGGDERGDSI